MTSRKYDQVYNVAKEWTLEVGRELKNSIYEQVKVEYKTSAADLVTEKDKEIESFFIEKINEFFPTHYILGEEGQSSEKEFDPTEELVWVIDPIDGTTNFVHQKENFAISVAFYEKGEPIFGIVYDPIRDELFHAYSGSGAYANDTKLEMVTSTSLKEGMISVNPLWIVPNEKCDYKRFTEVVQKARGMRYIGSAALEMAYVAIGRLDAYIDFRLSPWDIAAGVIILEEVGIISTTVENKRVDIFNNTSNVVARPILHDEILKSLTSF